MFLGYALALRPAKNVQRPDEKQAVYVFSNRRINDAAHQDGMKVKIRVGNANHIDDGADAFERLPDRLFVLRIPSGDLSQRIVPELFLQSGL